MIATSRYNFKLWKILASGIISIGLFLILAYCSDSTSTAQQMAQGSPPPEIIGFTHSPSGSLLPGDQVKIQVDVKRNGHRIINCGWASGEGEIISGNGTPQIVYEAPKTPGIYRIYVTLEFQDAPPITNSTTIVVAEPTPIPSPTPETPKAVVIYENLNLRSGPGVIYPIIGGVHKGDILDIRGRIVSNEWIQVSSTNPGISGWVSALAQYVQINVDLNTLPIVTPPPLPTLPPTSIPVAMTLFPTLTPTLSYTAPILTSPADGTLAYGTYPPLDWTWTRALAEDEFFEVRIWHESITTYHPALGWVKVPHFDYNIEGERDGKYYWTVAIVRGADPKPKEWTLKPWWPYPMWEGNLVAELSRESQPGFFIFTTSTGRGCSDVSCTPSPCHCDEPPCNCK